MHKEQLTLATKQERKFRKHVSGAHIRLCYGVLSRHYKYTHLVSNNIEQNHSVWKLHTNVSFYNICERSELLKCTTSVYQNLQANMKIVHPSSSLTFRSMFGLKIFKCYEFEDLASLAILKNETFLVIFKHHAEGPLSNRCFFENVNSTTWSSLDTKMLFQ